ncbi:MAG: zinc metallopeptidase [Bosea sp. (in: a-proteobacteria)]
MPILLILGAGLLMLAIFAPQWWVRRTLERNQAERADFPGTGAELARHLLDEAGLQDVKLEPTAPNQDHYDPIERVVRLSPVHHDGRSIAAVAVAAHEVAHAVQHARGERLFDWRGRLVKLLIFADYAAMGAAILVPILGAISRHPAIIIANIAVIVVLLALRVIVHLVTLPVEIDASFGKALPVLERGGYLAEDDMPAARQVLKAAAYTYMAAALVSLLDFARLIRIGR